MTGLGSYDVEGGRGVATAWEEVGASSHVGDVSDAQWEIFKLAFAGSGRVAVLSDQGARPGCTTTASWRH